ncbi:hypothetical protein [Streptosporangium sandarakinum]|uniref:hypothetical protein n=1 Tax=Streptosporangium sandarakinum TaxID=1260955 RepID=UPI00371A5C27
MSTVESGRRLWAQRHPAKPTTPRPREHTTPARHAYGTNTPINAEPPTIDTHQPNPWRERRAPADWQPATH